LRGEQPATEELSQAFGPAVPVKGKADKTRTRFPQVIPQRIALPTFSFATGMVRHQQVGGSIPLAGSTLQSAQPSARHWTRGREDRIIRHLELTFVAEKPPPAHVFAQTALMADASQYSWSRQRVSMSAAEESGEYE